jgi:hypothetical protein
VVLIERAAETSETVSEWLLRALALFIFSEFKIITGSPALSLSMENGTLEIQITDVELSSAA